MSAVPACAATGVDKPRRPQAIGLLASYLPAVRASRVDPIESLRGTSADPVPENRAFAPRRLGRASARSYH
jgi:hypothetical protein